MWEQYIRDLAIFGTNAIELIPPRSDDAADSPHFPLPQMRDDGGDVAHRRRIRAGRLGLVSRASTRTTAIRSRSSSRSKNGPDVLSKLPRVDAVFVPGGDPGHTQPKHLMALLEKQTASLHSSIRQRQMWMSPQGFTKAWMDEFYGILQDASRRG